jgi:hypothetical protein
MPPAELEETATHGKQTERVIFSYILALLPWQWAKSGRLPTAHGQEKDRSSTRDLTKIHKQY